jgi:uncharacterized HAD superfamily protein
MDDVLCETARGCLAIVEREFGRQVAYEQLLHFDLGESLGLEQRETDELYRIVHHPDELLKLEPIDGANAVLNQWAAAGYEIAIVTGRPPKTYEPSLEWLTRHRLHFHTFTMVDKYARFETTNTIAITLPELAQREYHFAVEDSPSMANYLATQMEVSVKLFNRPWNRAGLGHPKITRYDHWREIADVVPEETSDRKE